VRHDDGEADQHHIGGVALVAAVVPAGGQTPPRARTWVRGEREGGVKEGKKISWLWQARAGRDSQAAQHHLEAVVVALALGVRVESVDGIHGAWRCGGWGAAATAARAAEGAEESETPSLK